MGYAGLATRWGDADHWHRDFACIDGGSFVELLKVPPEHPASRDLILHVALVSGAFCFYVASLMLRWSVGLLGRPTMAAVALDGAGFVLLGAAGWVGGRLVYQHRLGTAVSSKQ